MELQLLACAVPLYLSIRDQISLIRTQQSTEGAPASDLKQIQSIRWGENEPLRSVTKAAIDSERALVNVRWAGFQGRTERCVQRRTMLIDGAL